MEHLPDDALNVLSSFLTGFDAFQLSHVSSWWLQFVGDGVKWQTRLLSATTTDPKQLRRRWAKRLMVAPSLMFQGRQARNNLQLDSFAHLKHGTEPFHLSHLNGDSFSFDVWFVLLPASHGKSAGGIIYGRQSASRNSRPWPHYHLPVVVVNAVGDLYCSVLESKPVVGRLQHFRWYHLALSYDSTRQRQDVWLDGAPVQSEHGALHNEWELLSHEQVGTGCVTGAEESFPYRGCLGWYGFRGIIDDFRVWSGVLSQDDVVQLSHGGRLSRSRLCGWIKQGGATKQPSPWVNVQVVACTRPSEREIVSSLRTLNAEIK